MEGRGEEGSGREGGGGEGRGEREELHKQIPLIPAAGCRLPPSLRVSVSSSTAPCMLSPTLAYTAMDLVTEDFDIDCVKLLGAPRESALCTSTRSSSAFVTSFTFAMKSRSAYITPVAAGLSAANVSSSCTPAA